MILITPAVREEFWSGIVKDIHEVPPEVMATVPTGTKNIQDPHTLENFEEHKAAIHNVFINAFRLALYGKDSGDDEEHMPKTLGAFEKRLEVSNRGVCTELDKIEGLDGPARDYAVDIYVALLVHAYSKVVEYKKRPTVRVV